MKKVNNGYLKLFVSNTTVENRPNSLIVFDDFMNRGQVWHIKVLIDNEYVPIYAFEEDRGHDECPQVLSGLGGTISCYHNYYDESYVTAL